MLQRMQRTQRTACTATTATGLHAAANVANACNNTAHAVATQRADLRGHREDSEGAAREKPDEPNHHRQLSVLTSILHAHACME